jgi:hypothetical protein
MQKQCASRNVNSLNEKAWYLIAWFSKAQVITGTKGPLIDTI